jgi:predicted DNA-binding transcriptional regulator AlpA
MSTTTNQELLSERDVSILLGLSEPTLFRHRRNGTGPRFIRLSARRIAYRRSAIEEWLKGCECQALGSVPSLPIPSERSHAEQTSVGQPETSARHCGRSMERTLRGRRACEERGVS